MSLALEKIKAQVLKLEIPIKKQTIQEILGKEEREKDRIAREERSIMAFDFYLKNFTSFGSPRLRYLSTKRGFVASSKNKQIFGTILY